MTNLAKILDSGQEKVSRDGNGNRIVQIDWRKQHKAGLAVGEPFRAFVDAKLIFNAGPVPEEMMVYKFLSPGAKLCYARLLRYQGVKGEAFPSYARLAKSLGVSNRQACRYIKELREQNFIKHSSRRSSKRPGETGSNEYKLLYHPIFNMTVTDVSRLKATDTSEWTVTDSSAQDSHHQDSHSKDSQPKQNILKKPVASRRGSETKTIDDDDEREEFIRQHRWKSTREPLQDPLSEFTARLKERHSGIDVDRVTDLVIKELGEFKVEIHSFLGFDQAETGGCPKNPTGYYRSLAKRFREKREAERITAQRERAAAELERQRACRPKTEIDILRERIKQAEDQGDLGECMRLAHALDGLMKNKVANARLKRPGSPEHSAGDERVAPVNAKAAQSTPECADCLSKPQKSALREVQPFDLAALPPWELAILMS